METNEQLQAEGENLAKKHQWDGLAILQVCEAALTDSNFHHESEIIALMIEALDKHDQPGFTLVVTVPDETSMGDDFGGVEIDPISGLPEHLFRNDDESEDATSGNYSY